MSDLKGGPRTTARLLSEAAQTALETLHSLRTYELSSMTSVRYQALLDDVYRGLLSARNAATSLAIALANEEAPWKRS